MKGVLSAILAFEAILVGLAIPVTLALSDGLPTGAVVGAGLGLVALCVVTAGLVRRPVGIVLGSLVQVLTFALGFAVPVMFVLGVVFGALWVWCLVQDRRMARVHSSSAQTE